MDTEKSGIFISGKEMYESITQIGNEFRDTSQQILTRLSVLESKFEGLGQTEERSREALRKADEAYHMASKIENQQVWLWRILVSSLVTGAITILFSFLKKTL
ncbi:hemolysin XhlA family protein [Thermoactinomyces sp. DSM 45892]|uniref:hemolysin XhlA family protein n=1 Tax=Thermoactinomyces sp. DSM 45892 TaxID=1882753 RepID=UPI00089A8AD5|nr:hemolysin XhlA family protein [Thermoactinomyces sp. DSM 45892]SDZ01164.1 Haemolysin XhlA [Thermoactinomyces sp. DSM 45892]